MYTGVCLCVMCLNSMWEYKDVKQHIWSNRCGFTGNADNPSEEKAENFALKLSVLICEAFETMSPLFISLKNQ